MCGIFGWIDPEMESMPAATLAGLRDLMHKRGPDGSGDFREGRIAMSMRRLSVVDLEHGGQPLKSEDGQVVAFQNGEIYNHADLRRELEAQGCRFQTASDTEALAHGFARWGMEGLLERLDGMYGVAIFDRQRRVLHLARDRFGEKPLYYARSGPRFAYSSHLLCLAALPWVDASIDVGALDRYLGVHYVPGDSTILRGVRRMLPGQSAAIPIDDPAPLLSRYYQPLLSPPRCPPSDDELADLIERAVVSRLMADVPVGIFLSGGIDSSILASVAARHHPGIATFSMGFSHPDFDESSKAERVARAVGSRHHRFEFNEESFLGLMPEVAAALDEPLGDQAMLPLYWLCREARKHVTVVLSGEGADEIFAGYGYYADAKGPEPRFLGLRSLQTPSGFPLLTTAEERARLTGAPSAATDAWESRLLHWLEGANDPLQRATAADLGSWLPDDLLVKFDRMSMAHSLEGRAPYLEPRLAEAGLLLPGAQRLARGVSKVALRRVGARWVPPVIAEAPKQGFVLPMEAWLRQWFESRGGPEEYFAPGGEASALDPTVAASIVADDLGWRVRRPRLLFALVAFVEWERSFRERRRRLHDTSMEALARPGASLLSRADGSAGSRS